MAYFLHLEDEICNAPTVVDGYLVVSREPGFGYQVDLDKLHQYATHPSLASADLR